ncbi:hypothetical protein PEP31012_00179 [Pandoraea eparura]|uniref:Uncharacterized protein n=1 Tax=Pandoraea eparura TaxID=2508291 RepID=A0A5E4RGU5_9BURK|nr:hypothetical protein [Pandoraea eparura]VVD62566.1 hypothetical protein PEP31012_00179 [Pandoraea eparura]
MVMAVRTTNDEDIINAMAMKKWSPLEGALLVCKQFPVASNGKFLTLEDCRDLAIMSSNFETAERIFSLWKSEPFGSICPTPNAFLLWCKYRNIKEADWFVKRVAQVAPRFMTVDDPERFSDPSRLKAACEKALAPFLLSHWGIPASSPANESETWTTRKASGSAQIEAVVTKEKPLEHYPSSGVIAKAFDGCIWSMREWSVKLKDPGTTKWLVEARKSVGGVGTSGALWNPIELASALYLGVNKKLSKGELASPAHEGYFTTRTVGLERLSRVFETTVELAVWREDWERKAEVLKDYSAANGVMKF